MEPERIHGNPERGHHFEAWEGDGQLVTIVTPAFNEEENLPLLHKELCDVLDSAGIGWEWIVVDDHSGDATFEAIQRLAGTDSRIRGVRFSKNSGSHAAMTCGLQLARGDCVIVMAADLQHPPSAFPELLEKWQNGAQVVWAVRARREGESLSKIGTARVFYWIMRHLVGIREMPGQGADFFLVDRRVVDAFLQFGESNASILTLITWMGFRQDRILFDQRARRHGDSGWSLQKKLKLMVDSITAFTFLPIRLMTYVGFAVALVGFLYATVVLASFLFVGNQVQGWASLMIVVLILGGIQMLMTGMLGEYVWRSLDEARRRPRYLIEAETIGTGSAERVHGGSR